MFLPEGARDFIQRRLVELAGFAVFVLAGLYALALVTYNPADPSFNHATMAAPTNALGRPGAYVADVALQVFGLGGALVAIVLGGWSWRIASHRPLKWPLTVAAAVTIFALLPLGCATLSLFEAPAGAVFAGGYGGWFGRQVLGLEIWALSSLGMDFHPWGMFIAQAPLVAVAFIFAFGIALDDWRALGRSLLGAFALMRRAAGRVRHPSADDGDSAHLRDRAGATSARRIREPKFGARSDLAPDGDGEDGDIDRDGADDAEEGGASPVPRTRTPRVERPNQKKAGQQSALVLQPSSEHQLPPLNLLTPAPGDRKDRINEDALEQNARMLESVLADFGVQGQITKVRPGPVVTLYELEPAPGTKASRVIGLADDIARNMSAISARIAVIPGRNAIGIELPNAKRETVYLRELLSSPEYENTTARLTLALGKDIGGAPVIADLARMPHLLIAGTTGSGKSVGVNTMILSLLYRLPPEQCRFIMIDPKMLELSVYDGIPHLLAPVVTEPGKAVVALKWTVREMEDRYRKMSELGVRNITGYNERLAEARAKNEALSRTVQTGFDPGTGKPVFEERPLDLTPLPFIVVIVDEFADLMMVAGKDIEASVQRLAQMARAAGIHLLMATQRPSVDVITGTIKANFPTRISFQVTSKIDSRTILGEQGAEQLLGAGDMLYMPGAGRTARVHGPFVSDAEVEKVVKFLKAQGEPVYLEAVTEEVDGFSAGPLGGAGGGEGDDLYRQAVALVARERKASTSFIQRHFQIGYNRAARIVDQMEAEGIVGKPNHVGKREVLIGEQ